MNYNNRSAVHIYLSTFENESRILKQTKSLIDHKILDSVTVIARGRESLEGYDQIDENRSVRRIRPHFMRNYLSKKELPKGYGLYRLITVIRLIEFVLKMMSIVRKKKPVFINLHQVLLLPFIPFFKLASFKSKFIYDAHELETETNGLSDNQKKILKLIERIFIKRFTYIFVVSPSIEAWYRDTYGISNIATVMNCPNYVAVEKKDLFRKEFKINESTKIFLYQGALFKGRGIEVLLETFKTLPAGEYCLILMGYGELEAFIKEYTEKYKNIIFKPAVPPEVVLDYTASADYGISLIENICLSYYYCLPNKLFEYIMAEIPVIVSDMEEMRDFIDSTNAGIVSNENSVAALTHSILSLDAFNREQFHEHIDNIKKKYSWENQEEIMIEKYKEIIKKNDI